MNLEKTETGLKTGEISIIMSGTNKGKSMTYQVDYSKCPSKYMEHGVKLYVEEGIQPGSFLRAVLANDFMGAVARADSSNGELLREWAQFVYNYLPPVCWGSYETVDKWKGLNNGS